MGPTRPLEEMHMPFHWKDHIVSTPDTLRDKQRIKGMRIPISLLLGYLAARHTIDEIIAEFPDLKRCRFTPVLITHVN